MKVSDFIWQYLYKISGSKIESKMGKVTAQNFNIKNKTPDIEIDIKNMDASIINMYFKLKLNGIY